ncbi:MAG: hypothetical protein JXN61_15730 [Sedimentisphaerales bacterium]|nr:hypothetical protein [Sedimentisphaerales bacterium]
MRLWTWQKKGFLLHSGRVESLMNSAYLNDFSRAFSSRLLMVKAYVKVWELFDTDQILWCFTDKKEAVGAKNNPWCHGCHLWEIDVPVEKVKLVCCVAWHWVLQRGECGAPSRFENLFDRLWRLHLSGNVAYTRNDFYSDFNSYWAGKSKEGLLASLLISATCYGCAEAIVFHPIDENWIVKDPTKVGEWWADKEDRNHCLRS